MYHVHAEIYTVHGKLSVPLRLASVNRLQIVFVQRQVQQMIFDAERTVETFENARGLHVNEPVALGFVVFDSLAYTVVGAVVVWIGQFEIQQ